VGIEQIHYGIPYRLVHSCADHLHAGTDHFNSRTHLLHTGTYNFESCSYNLVSRADNEYSSPCQQFFRLCFLCKRVRFKSERRECQQCQC